MDELDNQYLQTRQAMREWQSQMLLAEPSQQGQDVYMKASVGGSEQGKTPAAPETVGSPAPPPTQPVSTTSTQERPTFTVDTPEAQAVRQQYQEQFSKMASGETAVEAVGRGGKALAEATRPGFVTAARALGMDENAAEAVGDAFVEFMGGLPGNNESDFRAGIETALAALPVVGAIAKTGEKGVALLAANKDAIVTEFQKAVKLLKSERGSVPLGSGESFNKNTPPGASGEPPLSSKQLATLSKREEAKQAHGFAVDGFLAELTKQRRGPVLSDEAVRKLAGQSGFTLQDLLDLKPGSILAPEIQIAAREVYDKAADRLRASAKAYLEIADEAALADFAEAFAQAGVATTRIIGTYAEGGRTFRILNRKHPTTKTNVTPDVTDPEFRIQDPYIQQMYEFFRGAEEKTKATGQALTPGHLATMVSQLKTRDEVMAFAKAATKPTWQDMIYEVWINGLLSGPQTHATNMISNAATILWTIPERQLAGLLHPSTVRPGEAAAMVGGVVESMGDAWRLAWKAFKEEATQFGGQKMENASKAITADALELTGTAGRAVDFLGNAARVPGRFLLAADDFFKAIAFRAELRALAKRRAFQEINEMGLTGKEAVRKAKEIEHRILSDPPETIKESAQEFASYVTFTRDLGETGKAVQLGLQKIPFGRVAVPFIRTPTNIFKFAGERTPLALASKAVREELMAGGERAALAQAKIALGSMTMAYVATLAANGTITGGGPKDKTIRQQMMDAGWQPYSFKVGNQYIQYSRIEPLGSILGLAADATDIIGQLPEKQANELASSLVVALSRNFAQKTFVKGLAGTMSAITSQDVTTVKNFLEKELPTLMPFSSALKQTARYNDPILREVNSLYDAFAANVPGFSTDLPPQRNLFGEPQVLEGGLGWDLVSPLYTRTLKADPVRDELARLGDKFGVVFDLPSKRVDGVDLSPKLYDRYSELAGAGRLMGNKNLHDTLEQTMHSTLYRQADDGKDGGKVTLIRQDIFMFRDLAKEQLAKENQDFKNARTIQRMREATKFNAQERAKVGPAPSLR